MDGGRRVDGRRDERKQPGLRDGSRILSPSPTVLTGHSAASLPMGDMMMISSPPNPLLSPNINSRKLRSPSSIPEDIEVKFEIEVNQVNSLTSIFSFVFLTAL
jgi:hypothetical protein